MCGAGSASSDFLYSADMFAKKRTYLDWAAAAPVTAAAARAHMRALAAYGNPSSPHAEGRAAKEILESARTAVAREMMMKPDDIVFTSGATESNNIAIQGVLAAALRARPGVRPHLLYLPSAHASVVETMRAAGYAADAEPLPVIDGKIGISALKRMLRPETILVSMDFACGETGTLWNVREVLHALDGARTGTNGRIYLHVDASQAPWTELPERTRLAGDLITLDAQKIGGMRGAGILAAPRLVALDAITHGGGQERGVRPGTPAVAHAAAFAAALAAASAGREAFARRARSARLKLVTDIRTAIPDSLINEGADGVPHILNISLPGRDTDYLVALLDEAGFAVSTKSACESDSEQGSRAVLALTGDAARAKSTLRISWGPSVRERDLHRFVRALIRSVQFLDSNNA